MKNKDRRVLFCIIGVVLAIVITIVIGILLNNFVGQTTGQVSINNENRVEETGNRKTDEASERLSQKYNKDFVIKEVYNKKIGQSYYEVDAYPSGEPDILFRASIDTNDKYCSDNYVERYICKQISDEIHLNLGFADNIYVFTEGVGPQPKTDNVEQSIQEYANLDPLNKFRASIFVTDEIYGLYDSSTLFSS